MGWNDFRDMETSDTMDKWWEMCLSVTSCYNMHFRHSDLSFFEAYFSQLP